MVVVVKCLPPLDWTASQSQARSPWSRPINLSSRQAHLRGLHTTRMPAKKTAQVTLQRSHSGKESSFVVDGISLRPELDSAAARLKRHYYRRPDRHPFIIDAPSSIFFATRAMPQTNSRYPAVVGEAFWRLAAYIDSVPSRMNERIAGKPPHVLLRGMPGCGKSYLMASISALLGTGPNVPHLPQMHYLSADYRSVFIGDCKRWLDSDDPLTYFRMELLAGFRDESTDINVEDHHSEEHLGCLVCVEPFVRVEQVRRFMERCCQWIKKYHPDSLFVFFIDQAEELIGKQNSIPFQIVQQLLEAKMPLLVFSVATPHDVSFPFGSQCGVTIDVPYRVTSQEFAKHVEVHGGLEEKLYKEASWWKDMRLWTSSIPCEIRELVKMPGPSVPARLQAYRKMVAAKVSSQLVGISRLDGRQRNVLLILLFAIVLRVPVDMSGEFNRSNILALGPSITNLLLLDCLQAFYHTSDGIITMKDVPAAVSMAVHLALCSTNTLSSIIRTWPALFENVVHAMMQSKLLCIEAKRRMSRFYAHAKLLWGRQDWQMEGSTEMGESLRLRFRQPRVVIFAGQTPMLPFIAPNTPDAEHHGVPGNGDYDVVAFLPGRTSYWFFDLFILVPEERKLYAITTSAVVGTWLKELQTRAGPMQLQQQRDDGLLTPMILLDHWRDALKRAGLARYTVKCCLMKTMDLMAAAGYSPPADSTATPTADDSCVQELAQHLEASSAIKDDD